MNQRFVNIFFAFLFATTLYHGYVEAQGIKKRILLKGLVGAGLLLKYLKPKKGILPIPLPLPMPLPIEWEQPPIIVHSKHHHVPVPQPVPMPVHVPVHVPIHHHQSKYMLSESYQSPDFANYGGGYDGGYGGGQDGWNDGGGYGDDGGY